MRSFLTTAAAVQFSDEYKFDVSTDSYLKFVEQYGRIITEQDTVFNRLSTGARESYDLTNWLLFLAICLFVADVAMRRFQFVPKIAQGGLHGRSAKRERTVEKTAENAVESTSQDMSNTANENTAEKDYSKDLKKKKREPKKSKKKGQSEQTLDTSQLLRKKDDRSL